MQQARCQQARSHMSSSSCAGVHRPDTELSRESAKRERASLSLSLSLPTSPKNLVSSTTSHKVQHRGVRTSTAATKLRRSTQRLWQLPCLLESGGIVWIQVDRQNNRSGGWHTSSPVDLAEWSMIDVSEGTASRTNTKDDRRVERIMLHGRTFHPMHAT